MVMTNNEEKIHHVLSMYVIVIIYLIELNSKFIIENILYFSLFFGLSLVYCNQEKLISLCIFLNNEREYIGGEGFERFWIFLSENME